MEISTYTTFNATVISWYFAYFVLSSLFTKVKDYLARDGT